MIPPIKKPLVRKSSSAKDAGERAKEGEERESTDHEGEENEDRTQTHADGFERQSDRRPSAFVHQTPVAAQARSGFSLLRLRVSDSLDGSASDGANANDNAEDSVVESANDNTEN